ncbi:flagellar hook assembly protein FlgD [Clostridium taeniosporum]|uniref:Basal-body rod modification protein FlgD n=1 Tax=Clostridium taeniosporum TaxID=394958 RepID=A0A1D7XHW7_9CLOT|nr:flagellar hook capping FlgD N-terminal domain-containing protein [Clostridium taeniosporum]AOR22931.1 flagellar biosynthesis protein FlgD [Clostridium taeniosporum]
MTYSMVDVNKALGKTDASNAVNSKKNSTQGKVTTDRGTKITESGQEFDKNSFLKLLSAQLSNLDPTSDQDSTAYVTQMAQFAAMEQMYNLNDTMTTFSHQQLVGKGATMNVVNTDGEYYTGVIRGVSKDKYGTHVSMEVNENGKNKFKVFDVKDIQTILNIPDQDGNMSVNSDFLAASALKDQKVVLSTYDKDGKNIITKGTVKSSFIDMGVVKIRVETDKLDESGKPIIEDFQYSNIIKAGDLTEEDMDVKPEEKPEEKSEEASKVEDTDKINSQNLSEEEKTSQVLGMVDNKEKVGYTEDYTNELEKLKSILG